MLPVHPSIRALAICTIVSSSSIKHHLSMVVCGFVTVSVRRVRLIHELMSQDLDKCSAGTTVLASSNPFNGHRQPYPMERDTASALYLPCLFCLDTKQSVERKKQAYRQHTCMYVFAPTCGACMHPIDEQFGYIYVLRSDRLCFIGSTN